MIRPIEPGCLALIIRGVDQGLTVKVGNCLGLEAKYNTNIPDCNTVKGGGVNIWEIDKKITWYFNRIKDVHTFLPLAAENILMRIDDYHPSIEEMREQTLDLVSEQTGVIQ